MCLKATLMFRSRVVDFRGTTPNVWQCEVNEFCSAVAMDSLRAFMSMVKQQILPDSHTIRKSVTFLALSEKPFPFWLKQGMESSYVTPDHKGQHSQCMIGGCGSVGYTTV